MRENFSIFFKVTLLIPIFILSHSCVESEISRTLPAVTSGTISGTAIDVFTGQALADTWLCLSDGTTCTQTDGNGNYTFSNVSFGQHTITPYDGDGGSILNHPESGEPYQGFTFTMSSTTPSSGFQVSSGDSQKLNGSMTIITTWSDLSGGSSDSQDIDAHIIIPLGGDCNSPNNGSKYFQDSSNNGYTILDFKSKLTGTSPYAYNSSPFATLDLDDLGQDAGNTHMETMKIKLNSDNTPKCNGDYHFYLNNFHFRDGDATNFKDLNVKVRVLINGSVAAEYEPNDSGGNKYWGVFNLNSSGQVQSINQYVLSCRSLYAEVDSDGRCSDATTKP